jgi:hypothetical protein
MGPPGGFEKERMRKREGIVPLLLMWTAFDTKNEGRERGTKRLHDAEPLSARLWKHREQRGKRFHDVEPLSA